MAGLRKLIKDQKLSFDTHQAGDGQIVKWRSVHLEKRHNNKRGKIRVPLLSDERPTNGGMRDADFRKISSEVRKELRKNRGLVGELAKTVVDVIDRFSGGDASVEDCVLAAKKLADFFGLSPETRRSIEKDALNGRLKKYTSIHRNPANEEFVVIEQSGEVVIIGQLTNEELTALIRRFEA